VHFADILKGYATNKTEFTLHTVALISQNKVRNIKISNQGMISPPGYKYLEATCTFHSGLPISQDNVYFPENIIISSKQHVQRVSKYVLGLQFNSPYTRPSRLAQVITRRR